MNWRFTFNDELSASVFPLDFEGIRSVFASTCWHWYRLFSKPFFCFLLVGADWQVYIRQVRSALIDARNWPAGSQATPWTKCKCSFNICRTLPAHNYNPSCQSFTAQCGGTLYEKTPISKNCISTEVITQLPKAHEQKHKGSLFSFGPDRGTL